MHILLVHFGLLLASMQCSFSACSPLKMNVSHCCRSIFFPRGLSGFLVYVSVAISVAPAHITFLSSVLISPSSSTPAIISSFLMFPADSSLSWLTPVVVTLPSVSAALSSNRSPATFSIMSSTICLSPSTSFSKAVTSVHPLHVNAKLSPLVSDHVLPHPELSNCIQLLQLPHTRCLLATTFLLFGAIARLLALKKTYCTDFLVDELTLTLSYISKRMSLNTLFYYIYLTPGALVIAGDFNIHVDDHSDKEAADFLSLIESFCLKQHVCGPTHGTGHTLDLVHTRDRDSLAPTVSSQDHCFPDHFPVFCDLSLTTEYSRLQEVTYRKIKAINADCCIRDVSASVLCSTSATTDLDADVALYNTTLSTIVNMHAPEKTRMIPARPQPGWYIY